MVSKRFGNKFDYFKKYNILCQSEDIIKFCRKFSRNRGMTTLYSWTYKKSREFSLAHKSETGQNQADCEKTDLGLSISKTTLFTVN